MIDQRLSRAHADRYRLERELGAGEMTVTANWLPVLRARLAAVR